MTESFISQFCDLVKPPNGRNFEFDAEEIDKIFSYLFLYILHESCGEKSVILFLNITTGGDK